MKFSGVMLAALLTGFSAFAQDNEVSCQVKVNEIIRYDFVLASPEGSKITIGDFEGFRVMLNHNAQQKFSLEIFDGNSEQRIYSDAALEKIDDKVTTTIWNRDIIFEAGCKLHK